MSEDFAVTIFNEVISDYVEKLKADGMAESEIAANLSDKKTEQVLHNLITEISTDTVDYLETAMYEKVLIERARASEFLARNEQIWAKGFVASEAMYILVLDFAQEFNEYIKENFSEKVKELQFRYLALCEIHGRACQQFLEIIYLVKAGFADGAYARWRSIYELSVIAQFIKENDENTAQAYFEAADTDSGNHDWAKAAPCFAQHKHVKFDNIQKQCAKSQAWVDQYKLACKVVHASPQGTFGRLGRSSSAKRVIPVGHSDYGLAMPAVNSALALALISTFFFGLFPYGDSIAYIQIVTKWANIVRKHYEEIEAESFSHDVSNSK